MTDIVLLKDGDNVLSASADVKKLPYTTDTLWSKLDSLVTRLALLPERPALTGGWDKTVKLEAITLALGGAQQAFPLSTAVVVPGLLFSFKDGTPKRLLSSSEISDDIDRIARAFQKKGQTAVDEAVAHARECRALAMQALKQELRRREFAWGDGGFLKIEGVGTAVSSAQLALTIDGAALLGETSKTVEVLRASLSFSAAASLAGGISAAVDARLELVIKADPSFANATAEFLSSFDLPQLPNIPRPRLRFPKVALPSLSLESMNWPDINAQFLDFDLKLPGFGAAPVKVVWTTPPGLHITRLSPLQIAIGPGQGKLLSDVGGELATLTGIALDYDGTTGQFTVAGAVGNMTGPIERTLADVKEFDLNGRLPFTIDILDAKTTVSTGTGFELARPNSSLNANAQAKLALGRIVVRSKEDPRLFIAFAAEFDASAAAAVGGNPGVGARLKSLKVIEPYPLELVCAAGTVAIEGLVRLVAMIKLPRTTVPDAPGLPVPDLSNLARVVDRLSDLLISALKWMARQAGEAGEMLSQLAQAGIEALARLIQMLRDAADSVLSHVVIEVRLDAETCQLRQILISPVSLGQGVTSGTFETKAYGVELTVPRDWQPSLLIDVSGPLFAALLVEPSGNKLKIASDLWLDRDGAAPQSAADTDKAGKRPDKRLITLSAEKKTDRTLALIAVDGGRVSYLQVLASDGGRGSEPLAVPDIPNPGIPGLQWPPQIPVVRERPTLRAIDFENDVVGGVDIDSTSVERLLPFFDAPGPHSSGSDKFGQYVEVTGVGNPKLVGSNATVPLGVKLKIGDFETTAELKLTLDLSTLCARITGGDAFVIRGKRKPGTMFGLEYVILPRKGVEIDNDGHFNQFQLDLSGGNPRMALHPDAEVKLFYRRLGGEGRGLSLRVDDFAIAKSGFDLIASVDPDEPVTLPGVDMPFRFSAGQLVVKNGRLLAFSITGVGQLPPELVGEASCMVKIMLGPDAAGDLAVLSCDAELDKTDAPIVCQTTRFTLTVAKLGFAVQDFGAEGGYQFYFLVTGTLVFTPPGDEFGKTFLKYLRGARLTLNKAPLGRDMRLLARSIEIQVPLDPKVNFNLFEIFAFEVRGFGFHPASPAFDGSPAMNISGQVKFREVGDVISAKIDCHSLWIAPPRPRTALPRVRFDGLTVALSLNGAGSIEGTALTVDENLSELERPFPLPKGVTASGFLASGQLKLSGWAPMTASMGFLELVKEKDHRHAFFLYGQMEKLSVPIPTPIKELYLREVGFGFGYRYTLAGLAQADQVTTPGELIRVLDDVSRYQGDLPKFTAWQPEMEGDRITLAMRALATVDSPYKSSEEVRLEEKKLQPSGGKSREEGFPNALLFDMAAALRSDLTLLVTTRAWFSVNYDTWMKKKDEISTKPPLRGYLYLSAPRKELLARLVSDPEGYIGDTPKLPEEVLEAFKSVHFASTLYIRPGLFHFEFGWPYELKLEVPRKPNKNFGLKAEGGLVFRVEDFSLLYGITLRARGFAEFGGSVGGSSLGASALARADFSLDAKFIAYLSLERASDPLFYGCLAFSCNLSFEIKFWVEIDIGFDSIRLSASYSQSFAISAAVEVAIGPSVLAGRAAVAISVGAFGRSLTLSVGFGFNEGDLVSTRRKVERFLALGLTAAVPDPAASLAPPPTAMPAGTEQLDERAKEAMTLGQVDKASVGVSEQPYEIDIAHQFKDKTFTPNTPLFWAMLFEVPAKPGTYVLQLVPRDATQAFTKLQEKDSDLATVGSTRSTFYCPAGTKFRLSGEAASTLRQLKADQGNGLEIDVDPTLPVGPDVDAEVAISGGKVLNLGNVLTEAFLTDTIKYDPTKKRITQRVGDVLDIAPETIHIDRPKARTRAEAEAELSVAADVSAKLSVARALVRGIEEKRSALISAICSSAEQIAREATLEGSHLRWPARPAPTADGVIDARDFGLTFVVRENAGSAGVGATLSQLFDLSEETLPPKALNLGIQLVDASGKPFNDNDEQPIRLFNPPSRFFDRANPSLARFTGVHDSRGVVLDWDLEPAWEATANIWHDPEYHLKTYRVQRVFKENGKPTTKLKPMETTTKAAAPLKPVVKGDAVEWQRVTPPVQFVDDFADLPDDLRPALLRIDSVDPDIQQKAVIAWARLLDRLQITGKVELVYTVQAIDIAGHEGLPVPFEIEIDPPKAAVPRVAQAELIVAYNTLPEVAKAASATLALRLDDRLDARPKDRERPQRLAENGTGYVLRIRRETSTPLGIYGVDAVTQALKRPTPDQFENKLADDIDVEFTLIWGSDAPKAGEEKMAAFSRAHALDEINFVEGAEKLPSFKVAQGQLKALKEALGIDPVDNRLEPRSVRVAIRRAGTDKIDASTWLVVDLRLRIGELGSDSLGTPRPRPVDTVVETFESPKVVGFAPLAFEDLAGEAGRLLIDYPARDSTLGKLLASPADALQRLRDGDRRVATRVRWNALPSKEAGPPRLIGGYDVFEADLTASLTRKDVIGVAVPIARVAALDPLTATGEPSTLEDYGAIEVFYPSETLRLSTRKGAARRRAWFSPAESLGVWPEVGIRRSVGLTVADAEIAQLFTRGQPTSVLVRFEGAHSTTSTLSAAVLLNVSAKVHGEIARASGNTEPQAPCLPRLSAALTGVSSEQTPSLETLFKNKDSTPLSYTQLRRLLHALVIDGANAEDWWNDPLRDSFAEHRTTLHGLSIEIEARYAGVSLGTITQKVDLDTALHPVLADVLDAVRWHSDDKEQSFYRRYEPVIDSAPPTDATTIGQFLDQRPIERDPYGWAILRTLGLAAGLRLSDTLSGDFVPPVRAIGLVRDAFATVLPRYRHGERELLQLGQPFVDLMTRAGGLYTVASFDGGDTTPDETTRKDILDNELVSLMQIALRPVAEAQVGQASSGARYYAVSLKEKLTEGTSFDFQMEGQDGVIDLQFLNSGLSRSSMATFADTSSADGKKVDLIERLSRGRTTDVQRTFTIPPSVMKTDTPFALVRVTWPGSEATDWTEILQKATGKSYAFKEINSPRVLESVDTEECLEAFERFPELPPTAITQLLSAQGSDARALFKRFLTLATARFGADGVPKPDATADLDAFFVRWPDLMRRFFSHGPSAAGQAGSLEVPFSLALMPRPMPLRSKVQEDGTMEMVVVHKDRLARRRRYFVRPFSRYDNIVAAWHAEHTDAFPWAGKRSLADSFPDSASAQPSLPAIKLADMDHYSLDITVPRSEPLAPPVVLSAQRLDVGEGTQQRPGRLLEFVVSRHQEEVASESNINVADSLQFEHLAFGFYREFRDIAWAKRLRTLAGWSADALDLLPVVKNENAFEPKPLSFTKPTSLEEAAEGLRLRKRLPDRLPDGWRGITALRTEDVPHFYRVHVVAFAAAGVVVSEPVVATVPEGQFTLTWPWKDEPNYKLAPPTWSITQLQGEVCLTLESPLVRYFDGMPDEQKAWSNSLTREQRRVYALPDPGVAYEIATVGTGGDSATEVALTALPDEQSAFFMAWTGTRLKAKASAPAKLLPPEHDNSNGWRLELPLERWTEPERPQPVPAPPEQRLHKAIAPVLGFAGSFEMGNDDDWAAFAPFAPHTDSWIRLTRPAVTPSHPDFNDAGFRQLGRDAEVISARLQAIKSSEGVSDVLGTRWDNALGTLAKIAEFRNLPGKDAWFRWQALFGGDQPQYAIDLPRFAGVPNWPASTTYIQMSGLSGAVWKMDHPNDVSFARRAPTLVALRRATAIPNDEAGKQNSIAFRRVLFAALWWEDRCDVLQANEQGLSAYPMVTALLPEALRAPAQNYVALFTAPEAALQPSPGLEFLARLDVQFPAQILDDSGMRDALTALLEHLARHELYPGLPGVGFGAALDALQGVENGEAVRADLLLPSVGLDKVVELINAVPGVTPVKAEKPIALTLRRPATDTEVGHVKAMGGSDLHRFVDRLATEQIFGAGREPRLKATKGFLDALYHVITRKED